MNLSKQIFRNSAAFVIVLILVVDVQAQTLLMNQIDSGNPFSNLGPNSGSQQFEAALSGFDSVIIDDFQYGGELINRFEFVGELTGGNAATRSWSNVTGFRVEFYSAPSAAATNLTGDLASLLFTPSAVAINLNPNDSDFAHVVIGLPNVSLTHSGQTWVGMIPIMNFGGGGGQTGIVRYLGAGFPLGLNGHAANPGGSYNIPGNVINRESNYAYRVGAAVPEPSASLFLSLIAFGCIFNRRRH